MWASSFWQVFSVARNVCWLHLINPGLGDTQCLLTYNKWDKLALRMFQRMERRIVKFGPFWQVFSVARNVCWLHLINPGFGDTQCLLTYNKWDKLALRMFQRMERRIVKFGPNKFGPLEFSQPACFKRVVVKRIFVDKQDFWLKNILWS